MRKDVPYIGLAAEPNLAKSKQEAHSRETPETRDSAARNSTQTSRMSKTTSKQEPHSSTKRSTKKSQNDDARNSLDRAKKLLTGTNTVQIKD